MSDPTRRGLFSFLLAGLAWLVSRRATAAPAAMPAAPVEPVAVGEAHYFLSSGPVVYSTYLGGAGFTDDGAASGTTPFVASSGQVVFGTYLGGTGFADDGAA